MIATLEANAYADYSINKESSRYSTMHMAWDHNNVSTGDRTLVTTQGVEDIPNSRAMNWKCQEPTQQSKGIADVLKNKDTSLMSTEVLK